MSLTTFKEKGVEYVKQAVELDTNDQYEQAFEYYMKGLEQFSIHCKYDKNPAAKEAIRKKMEEYMKRAEYLKTVVKQNTATDGDAAGESSTAVGQKKKPANSNDNSEREKMRNQLSSSIVTEKPNVHWEDVSGLEHAKDSLKEAVILPVKFPQFFTGKRKPWRGILLYGPPGTGKSYLAKAVATEADSMFFSVSSSDLVSKWMGESEKLVSELFSAARANSPSIIFIDEVDSLVSARGDNESEAARRIKTEFLVQMDGVSNNKEEKVLILGATNLPDALDPAIRRRFDKRIYIALPDAPARATMFKIHLGETPHSLSEADFRALGEGTDGFSGSDINLIVKDTLMQPVRKVQEATHFRPAKGPNGADGYWEPCAPRAPGAQEKDLTWFAVHSLADKVLVPPITRADFESSMYRARPTVGKEDLAKYEKFTADYGEEGV